MLYFCTLIFLLLDHAFIEDATIARRPQSVFFSLAKYGLQLSKVENDRSAIEYISFASGNDIYQLEGDTNVHAFQFNKARIQDTVINQALKTVTMIT